MERHIEKSNETKLLNDTESHLSSLRQDYLIKCLAFIESRHSDILDSAKAVYNALKSDHILSWMIYDSDDATTTLSSALSWALTDENDANYLRLSSSRYFEVFKKTHENFIGGDIYSTKRRLLLDTSFNFMMDLDELQSPEITEQ